MRAFALLAAVAVGAGSLPAHANEPPQLSAASSPTASGPIAAGPAAPAPSEPVPAAAARAPAAASPATPVTVAPAKPRPLPPAVKVRIDLSSQRLHVSIDGKPTHSWAISSGRAGYETPRGVFRPQWAARIWYSRKYDNAPMPHAVFFNGGVAVHATSATGLLGQPASHGCVRLAPGHAAQFYALVHKHGLRNVRIEVIGATPAAHIASRRQRPTQSASAGSFTWGSGAGASVSAHAGAGGGQRTSRVMHLPAGHPYKGRDSFEMNGVRWVRVR